MAGKAGDYMCAEVEISAAVSDSLDILINPNIFYFICFPFLCKHAVE